MQTITRRQFLGGTLASAVIAGLPTGASGKRILSTEVLVAASALPDAVPGFLREYANFEQFSPGLKSRARILEAYRASGAGKLVVFCDTPTLLGLLQSIPYPSSIHWVNPSVQERSEADTLYRLRDPGLPRPHLSVVGTILKDSTRGQVTRLQANLPDDLASAKQTVLSRLLCISGHQGWGDLKDVHTQGLNWRLMRLEFSGGRSAVFSRGREIIEGVRTRDGFILNPWLSTEESVAHHLDEKSPEDHAQHLWNAWKITETAFKPVEWNVRVGTTPGLFSRKGAFV